jgi:hypothetical protein
MRVYMVNSRDEKARSRKAVGETHIPRINRRLHTFARRCITTVGFAV